jgi:peptidoglycan/LPS O-acetylase OafA/YrhL
MSRATSLLLDGLRLVAALVVFVTHCSQFWWPRIFAVLRPIGHDAVVVFFVLSGYVIAFSTLRKNRGGRHYALARLARLYSVVLPALALTLGLQLAGTAINPEFYHGVVRAHDGIRMLLAAFFLQEVWTLSANPATNMPLWSLGSEFWYYAIFGAAVFVRPWRWKIALTASIALLAGYKILLLLPVWLLGVGVFLHGGRISLTRAVARTGCVAFPGLLVLSHFWLRDYPVTPGFKPLYYSGAFLTDLVRGVLVAGMIQCFDVGFGRKTVIPAIALPVRWAADHTFSLYVYHFPLIAFATAAIPFDHGSGWQAGLTMALILIVIVALSVVTESKRQAWHQGLSVLWDKFSRLSADGPAAAELATGNQPSPQIPGPRR